MNALDKALYLGISPMRARKRGQHATLQNIKRTIIIVALLAKKVAPLQFVPEVYKRSVQLKLLRRFLAY